MGTFFEKTKVQTSKFQVPTKNSSNRLDSSKFSKQNS